MCSRTPVVGRFEAPHPQHVYTRAWYAQRRRRRRRAERTMLPRASLPRPSPRNLCPRGVALEQKRARCTRCAAPPPRGVRRKCVARLWQCSGQRADLRATVMHVASHAVLAGRWPART